MVGGITGIFLATFPVDWQLTDTYFVVAHMHYVAFGGTAFAMMAATYYWFPKMTGKMLNERMGIVSFWLVFVGFQVTFLIQHSAGLSGMPRRIYEYTEGSGWHLYNLISTVGAFILAAGAVLSVLNLVRSLKRGTPAGPDPWKANTLEWFMPSPPPAQQLRRDPARALGRADEGHPPPGRAGVGHGAALRGGPADGAGVRRPRDARGGLPHEHADRLRRPRRRRRAPGRGGLRHADEAEGPVAAAADDGHDDVRGRRPRRSRWCSGRCSAASLASGGAGAVNHWYDRDIDARMARTATRPVPSGRVAPRAALAYGIALAALSFLVLSVAVNLLSAVLALLGFLGYVFVYTVWLKRSTPQNIVIGGAAGAVPPLVGWAAVTGHRGPHRAVPLRDRLLLDPAALLGAVAADEGRVRARGRADDARGPRRGRDAPPDPAVHGAAAGAHAAARRVRLLRR